MTEEVEKINLDDYVATGEGATAISYTHRTRDTIAKLYHPGFEADRAKEDFLTSCTVFELGIPTPKPIRLVTDGERFGAEYELIRDKRSFSRIISQEPERLQELSVTFAEMARKLHSTKADTTKLVSAKEKFRRFYLEKNLVPDFYRQKVLEFIEKVPDTPNCVHGDLQISNVITDGKRTLWIDMGDFCYGEPGWDLGMLWSMTNKMDEQKADLVFHMKQEELKAHWNIFFPAYLGTTDPQKIAEATKRILPFAAVKIPYMYDIAKHFQLPDKAFPYLAKLFG